MADYDPTDRVVKALEVIEKVLPHFEMTHAVVVLFNSEKGTSSMFGSCTGAQDLLRTTELLKAAAAQMAEAARRQIQ